MTLDQNVETSDTMLKNEPTKKTSQKIKALFEVEIEHPINRFQEKCRQRGIKITDLSEILLEAINQTDESWWDDKLESLTPLEYRVSAALADPSMREKLQELLAQQASKLQ